MKRHKRMKAPVARYAFLKLLALAACMAVGAAGIWMLPRVPYGMVGQQIVTNGLLWLLLLTRMLRAFFAEINSWKGTEKRLPLTQPPETPAEPAEHWMPVESPAQAPASGSASHVFVPASQPEPPTTATPARVRVGYVELCNTGMLGIGQPPLLTKSGRRSSFTLYQRGSDYMLEPSEHWLQSICGGGDLRIEQYPALFTMAEPEQGRRYLLNLTAPAALRETAPGLYELTCKGSLQIKGV